MGNRRRLFIIDGYSSHINIKLINIYDYLRILLLILPPYSTHRLKFFNVSFFTPLTTFYTINLNKLLNNNLNIISMIKRAF